MKVTKIFVLLIVLMQCSYAVAQSTAKTNARKVIADKIETIKAERAEMAIRVKSLKGDEKASAEKTFNNITFALAAKYQELLDTLIEDMQRSRITKIGKKTYVADLELFKANHDSMLKYYTAVPGLVMQKISDITWCNNVYNKFVQQSEDLISQMDGLTGHNLVDYATFAPNRAKLFDFDYSTFATTRDTFEYAYEVIMLCVNEIRASIKENYELTQEQINLYRNYFSAMEYLRGYPDEDLKVDEFQYNFDLFDIATNRQGNFNSKFKSYDEYADFDFLYIDLIRDCRAVKKENKVSNPRTYKNRFKKLRELDEERLKNSPLTKMLIEEIILKGYWTNVFEIPADAIKRAKKTNNTMLLFNYMR